MSSNTKTIINNIRWMTFSKLIVYLLSIFTLTAIPRYLGVSNYGQLNFVISFVVLFSVVGDMGLSILIYRDISKHPEKAKEYYDNFISFKILLLILMSLLIFIVMLFLDKNSYTKLLILILGIPYIGLGSLASFYLSFYNAFQKMQYSSIYDALSKLISVILIILVMIFDLRIIGILFANVFSLLIANLFLIFSIKRYFFPKIEFNINFAISKFKKVWIFAGISLFTLIYYSFDKLLIPLYLDYYQLGLYVIGYTFFGTLISLMYILNYAFFPVLSSVSNNKEKSKKFGELYIKYLFIFSIPITFGGIFLADKIIQLAFGANYIGGLIPFQIILLFFFIATLNLYNSSILLINHREKSYLYLTIIAAIVNILLNIFFIPIFGIVGSAIITLLSELLLFVGSLIIINKILKINYLAQIYKPLISVVIMILGLMAIDKIIPQGILHNSLDVLFTIFFGAIIYITVILLTKGITIKEIKLIISKKITGDNN